MSFTIRYEGPSLFDKPHGIDGHMLYSNGDEYWGGFFNGIRTGYGYMVDMKGEAYDKGIYFEDEMRMFNDHPKFVDGCRLFKGWILDYNLAYMLRWLGENEEGVPHTHSPHTPSPSINSFDIRRPEDVCFLLFINNLLLNNLFCIYIFIVLHLYFYCFTFIILLFCIYNFTVLHL